MCLFFIKLWCKKHFKKWSHIVSSVILYWLQIVTQEGKWPKEDMQLWKLKYGACFHPRLSGWPNPFTNFENGDPADFLELTMLWLFWIAFLCPWAPRNSWKQDLDTLCYCKKVGLSTLGSSRITEDPCNLTIYRDRETGRVVEMEEDEP